MKALAQLDQRFTTATGVGSGFLAWVLGHIETLTKVGQLVGVWACAIVSVISLVTTVRRKWSAWRARRAPIAEPPYIDDDIPMQ